VEGAPGAITQVPSVRSTAPILPPIQPPTQPAWKQEMQETAPPETPQAATPQAETPAVETTTVETASEPEKSNE
jgi:hypothetical protein